VLALSQVAESTVVALAMGGDDTAFAELVRRRQSALRNLLRRLSRDPALADDLAQITFLKAWRALPRLRSVAAFGAWLRRLAINSWLEHVRAIPQASVPLDTETEAAVIAATRVAADSAAGESVDLDRALATLAPDERLCIVLAYSEGMSHSEITAAIGLPLGTVKSHIKRGGERLRVLLNAYEPLEHSHVG
jgi:RNA polymerase sigma factor (sigma-70 family)